MKGRYVTYNYKNKIKNIKTKTQYMLARSLSMFEYSNLPTTLPRVEIEKQLQQNGFTFITEIEGELYALYGSLGRETDVYGNPTKIAISNPTLKVTEEYNVAKDVTKYSAENTIIFTLEEGFALVYPEDIHLAKAKAKDDIVEKAVIKIKIEK